MRKVIIGGMLMGSLLMQAQTVQNVIVEPKKSVARISVEIPSWGSPATATLASSIDNNAGSSPAIVLTGASVAKFGSKGVVEITDSDGVSNKEHIYYSSLNLATSTLSGVVRADYDKLGVFAHSPGSIVKLVGMEGRFCYRTPGGAWSDKQSAQHIGAANNFGELPTNFIYGYLFGLDAATTYEAKIILTAFRHRMPIASYSVASNMATFHFNVQHHYPVGRQFGFSIDGESENYPGVASVVDAYTLTANLSAPDRANAAPLAGSYSQIFESPSCEIDYSGDSDFLTITTFPNGTNAGNTITFTTTALADVTPTLPTATVDTTSPSSFTRGMPDFPLKAAALE